MNFSETPEFQKDVKRLGKKWRSLPSDIEAAKKYIVPLYKQLADDVSVNEYRQGFFAGKTAAIMHVTEDLEVVKMRLDVADIGRSDKTRLIFVSIRSKNTITFIELYAKNEKPREDSERIKKYLS